MGIEKEARCLRVKFVRRLPQELHLALFPQGQPRRRARVANVKCNHENEQQD
jgi:hypothetical protein